MQNLKNRKCIYCKRLQFGLLWAEVFWEQEAVGSNPITPIPARCCFEGTWPCRFVPGGLRSDLDWPRGSVGRSFLWSFPLFGVRAIGELREDACGLGLAIAVDPGVKREAIGGRGTMAGGEAPPDEAATSEFQGGPEV